MSPGLSLRHVSKHSAESIALPALADFRSRRDCASAVLAD
jgi:hypothetical protein